MVTTIVVMAFIILLLLIHILFLISSNQSLNKDKHTLTLEIVSLITSLNRSRTNMRGLMSDPDYMEREGQTWDSSLEEIRQRLEGLSDDQ